MLAVLALNVSWHVAHQRWFEAFWLCNAAALLLALALLLNLAVFATPAFIWLVPGTVCWAFEALALGGAFAWPSYLLHLTASLVAIVAVRRLGAHRRGDIAALALLATMLVVSRFLPAEANVNCTFGPRAGWRAFGWLPLPHPLAIAAIALVLCWSMNRLARRIAPARIARIAPEPATYR